MPHKIIFFILFLGLGNIMLAQNTILLETEDIEVSDQFSKVIPPDILKLIDADDFISSTFSTFNRSHLYYDAFSFNILFSSSGYLFGSLKEIEGDAYNYDILKDLFFKNKSFYEPLYNIVIPNYKSIVSKMTNDESAALIKFLKDGLVYTKSFNLEKEQSDEEKLNYFFVNEKGELNAFIYRRILANHLTKEEVVYWLERIIKDLESSIVKKEAAEDYIIMEEIGPNYFWAKKFGQEMTSEWQILKKEKDKFSLLTNEPFKSSINCLDNGCFSYTYQLVNYPNNKSEIFMIFPDEFNEDWRLVKYKFDKNVSQVIYGDNWICVLNEDGSAEYIGGISNTSNYEFKRRVFESKKIISISKFDYAFVLNYEDGNTEFFVTNYLGEIILNNVYNDEVIDFTPVYNNDLYHLMFFSSNSKFVSFKEPEKPVYVNLQDLKFFYIKKWKDYLVSIAESGETQEQHIIMDLNGKILLKSSNKIYSFEDASYLLIEEQTKDGFQLAFYDSTLAKTSKPIYNFGLNIYRTQDEELPEVLEDLNSTDNTLLLQINKYKKGKIVDCKSVMFDNTGQVIIPAKYGNISRINPMYYSENCLYVVCNKVKFVDSEMKLTGKFAFFNHQGKQLTDFIYDKVYVSYNDTIMALRNGIVVEIDREGREVN
jgi:hypothetical protein